jgi:hypothetical protein
MCSSNTPWIPPEPVHSYLLLNPFTLNIKQMSNASNYSDVVFLAWISLFRFDVADENSVDVF